MSNFFKAIKNLKPNKKNVCEYKLYYDKENGEPLFYSMDNDGGDYIVVDKKTYSEGRYDVYVKDKKLIKRIFKDISKLTQHGIETTCLDNDITIVADKGMNWSLRIYDN
jgi:hypothetical protein